MIHELSWTCLTTLLLAPTHSCQCCFLPIFVAPRNELLLRQTHIIICQFAMRTQRKTRRDAERHFEKKKRERASIFANHYYMKFNGNQQFQWLCGILLGHYIEIIVCFWFGKLLLHKKKTPLWRCINKMTTAQSSQRRCQWCVARMTHQPKSIPKIETPN